MAVPDDVTVPPPVEIRGSAPGAPVAMPLEGTLGAVDGAAAAARPGPVRPMPTISAAARPRATPTPRNRDRLDMAGAPSVANPGDSRWRTHRTRPQAVRFL